MTIIVYDIQQQRMDGISRRLGNTFQDGQQEAEEHAQEHLNPPSRDVPAVATVKRRQVLNPAGGDTFGLH